MGSLEYNSGLSLLQSAYLIVHGLNPLIILFSRNILSKSGEVFIVIFPGRLYHCLNGSMAQWLNGSLWVHIWHNKHDIIVVILCETILTNNKIHTRHHITTPVTIWNCVRFTTLRIISLSGQSSRISLLALHLIVRQRVLILIFGAYIILFKFNFTVIRLRGICSFLDVTQNPWLVWGFTKWSLTCDLVQSSVRYNFFRSPIFVHYLQAVLVFSMFIFSLC